MRKQRTLPKGLIVGLVENGFIPQTGSLNLDCGGGGGRGAGIKGRIVCGPGSLLTTTAN